MTDTCYCPPEAGNAVCDLPIRTTRQPAGAASLCPICRHAGKPVPRQTVKALLAVSLRQVQAGDYLFCRTPTCPVVYFFRQGGQSFNTSQVRARVYQKEPGEADVFICYCFRHTVGDLKAADPAVRRTIIADINAGIQAGQCACELQNPQGSCCLGNVRGLIKQLEQPIAAVAEGNTAGRKNR